MVSLYSKSVLLFLLLSSFLACEEDDPLPTLVEGIVVYMAPPDNCNDFVIATGEGKQLQLLKPNNLSKDLAIDSLRVRFAYNPTDQMHPCGFGGAIPVVAITHMEALSSSCTSKVTIDSKAYQEARTDYFVIHSATVTNNCLAITITSSGCDGNSWQGQLIDANEILESNPVQRRLRFILQNKELCQAVFTRTFHFDITPIQLSEYNTILLGIDELDELVSYTY